MRLLGNGKLSARFDSECPATREILSLVGDKWSVLVIVNLGAGPVRFGALRRTIAGISPRVLTHTLRRLERDGLVRRTVHAAKPPQVDYALTALGRTLLEPVTGLAVWAQRHRATIQRSRAAFGAR